MTEIPSPRLRFLRRAADQPRRRFRRGVYLLPSLLTMGLNALAPNMEGIAQSAAVVELINNTLRAHPTLWGWHPRGRRIGHPVAMRELGQIPGFYSDAAECQRAAAACVAFKKRHPRTT